MRDTATAVAEAMWDAWARRDLAATMALFSPRISFGLHIPQDTVSFGGGLIAGLPAVAERLQMILDQFDTVHYAGRVVSVHGSVVSGHIGYIFRHKLSGEAIDGVMRHVIVVDDGLVVDLDEYHDVERIKAFMRLVAQAAAR